jgi:hypothetical protein
MSWWNRLFPKSKLSLDVPCGHWAYLAACVAEAAGYEVTICVGPSKRGIPHAQAQARIDGKLEWLTVRGRKVEVGEREIAHIEQRHTPSVFWACWVP